MKLKEPKVNLETGALLHPGETLKGTVSWTLEKTIKVRKVQVFISGKCKVKWTKGSGDDEKTYKAKEIYIAHSVLLYGKDDGGEVSLAPGSYTKPFAYCLPDNLPPTFYGKHGTVQYGVSLAVQDTGFLETTKCHTVPFLISNPPANVEEIPVRLAAETDEYGCCCTTKADFKFEVNISKNFFSPGEQVIINGYAMNGSAETVENVELSLILQQTFYGYRSGGLKSKIKRSTVCRWEGEKIERLGQQSYVNQVALVIPEVPESDMTHCQFIDVKYLLEFKMELPGICSDDLKSEMEANIKSNLGSRFAAALGGSGMVPSAPPSMTITDADRQAFALAATASSSAQPAIASSVGNEETNKPPPYFIATAMDSTFAPPVHNTTASVTNVPEQNQTSYYDWSQSAFTYN